MATLVAEEAGRSGCNAFAKSIEKAMEGLLRKLPRGQQSQALRLSYEMALGGDASARPHLRLVYSRD